MATRSCSLKKRARKPPKTTTAISGPRPSSTIFASVRSACGPSRARKLCADFLLQIAPLMDNMRRALAQEAAEARSLKQGVELILSQFQTILHGYGLEEIEAVGHPFDPNLHEAMLEVESADCEPGTVLEEMEKGYRDEGKGPAAGARSRGEGSCGKGRK